LSLSERGSEEENGMTDWWSELENELLSCVDEIGLATPAEVGRRLGFSETSAASLLAILVREGKVRMCLVQSASRTPNVSGTDSRTCG